MTGTKDQCDAAQLELEQEKTHGNQQAWSSADTEVSSSSSSDSGSVRALEWLSRLLQNCFPSSSNRCLEIILDCIGC